MNYGNPQQQQQQQHQYMAHRMNQGQRMPVPMGGGQAMPLQPNPQQPQVGLNPNYGISQMNPAAYAQQQQMRIQSQTMGMPNSGPPQPTSNASAMQVQQQRIYQQQQMSQHMGMPNTAGAIQTTPDNAMHPTSEYINQLPMEVRQQIQAEPDPEQKKLLLQHHLRNKPMYDSRQVISMQQQQQQQRQMLAAQRQQQQQQQQQHPQSQAQMAYTGGNNVPGQAVSSHPQQQQMHMQRIPSQGSFGTPPNEVSSVHQMSAQQHAQQQQMQYNNGRGGVPPRGYGGNVHHGAAANANVAGGLGNLPPTMTLQQLNPAQQQQYLQHQQQVQQQHQLMQQQLQQQSQNVHMVQGNIPGNVHTSQPQLHQMRSGTPQQPPPVGTQQHMGGGSASHHSVSQQNSPMPPHGVLQQPHSIGPSPGSQPPVPITQPNVVISGPSSVPSHIQQLPQQPQQQHKQSFVAIHQQQQQPHGGPPSVSNVRPTTPSVRSVSSVGGPNSVGAGVQAANTPAQATSVPPVSAAIDQNAPEYRAALDQLKSYGKDCHRLLGRMRLDGSDKLVQSVERVLEIIEGRRVVDLKLLRRLIHNVCSALSNSNPVKGIKDISEKLSAATLVAPLTDVLPDVWASTRHLEIKVPQDLDEYLKMQEANMIHETATAMALKAKSKHVSNVVKDEDGNITDENVPASRKRKYNDMENAKPTLLAEFARSISSSDHWNKNPEIFVEGPIPVRVDCVNERYLILNEEISTELITLPYDYRFDPDYKPISENSPHVQIIVGFKSSSNVLASSWVPPLRLIIPIDYPNLNIQIFEERIDRSAKQPEVRNPLEHKRRQLKFIMSSRSDAIMDELKTQLDSKCQKSAQDTKSTSFSTITAGSKEQPKSAVKTIVNASINEVVRKWAEIAERYLASVKSTASINAAGRNLLRMQNVR